MITLSSQTTVALLITLMKQNYGKSWYCLGDYDIIVGIHSPAGEVAYKIPRDYAVYLKGMIEVPESDVLSTAFEDDSAARLLEWSQNL